jgi:hypothetical protein
MTNKLSIEDLRRNLDVVMYFEEWSEEFQSLVNAISELESLRAERDALKANTGFTPLGTRVTLPRRKF